MNKSINAVGLPAASGGLSAAVSFLRSTVYIDGFNLYHSIDDLGEPHLKWVNLYGLSKLLLRCGEVLERAVWCTAFNKKNHEKLLRWREYKKNISKSGNNL
jgi:hypothetical protein